ncbi:MAG: hypothetical protein JW751_28815 [Polyangiaceae bacterium]|nr:hypothetical protein [Polyangiaceae bacterium]
MTVDRGELEVSLALQRRFLGVGPDEPQEVTAFVRGHPWVGYAHDEVEHIALLRRAQATRGFEGAYLLVNPIDPRIADRYERGYWGAAHAGRASDKDVLARRAIYVDVDPVRPKGISATADERSAAHDAARQIHQWLADVLGPRCLAFGSSGNGYFILVAIVLEPIDAVQIPRLRTFLERLHRRYGSARAKVDSTVINPARLMPAGGTWKRKGADTPERPHRLTSLVCRPEIDRVPLAEIC